MASNSQQKGREDWFTELAGVTRALEKLQKAVGHVEDYIDASILLQGAWVVTGGFYRNPSYYLDPFGRVWLAGRVKSGALNSVVLQLPPGYRPPSLVSHKAIANDALARVEIDTSGNVTFKLGTASTYLDLDGISFKVV